MINSLRQAAGGRPDHPCLSTSDEAGKEEDSYGRGRFNVDQRIYRFRIQRGIKELRSKVVNGQRQHLH